MNPSLQRIGVGHAHGASGKNEHVWTQRSAENGRARAGRFVTGPAPGRRPGPPVERASIDGEVFAERRRDVSTLTPQRDPDGPGVVFLARARFGAGTALA